jgi:hypothetical protein
LGCGGGDEGGAPAAEDTSAQDAPEDAADRAPFEVTALARARINSHSDKPNFQNARGTVDWGDGPFRRVTLRVSLESSCFPFSAWTQPPPGHNWPADCDAFDRNFEVTLDPDGANIELVRAITPFGGPMRFEADITDIANALPGPHELNVHITTWSDANGQVSGADGGWWVSASVAVEPGPPPRRVLGVQSVFNGSFGQDAATGGGEFLAPSGARTTRFEYRATGHGGAEDPDRRRCIGPAEEFCQRLHTLSLDGKPFYSFTAWRDDCANGCILAEQPRGDGSAFTYCAENPCGAIQSVRAPRANWCPGSVTPPVSRFLDGVIPGQTQRLGYAVEGVYPGGSWRLSGLLLFYAD